MIKTTKKKKDRKIKKRRKTNGTGSQGLSKTQAMRGANTFARKTEKLNRK
jgi:hypothetical protein